MKRGFTLIEMMVVIAITATILAIAVPRFLPAILYSTHEGAARHLANYGRAAMAQASLDNEAITIKVDIDNQQYWAEHMPEPKEEADPMEKALQDDDALPEDDQALYEMASEELDMPDAGIPGDQDKSDAILQEQRDRMTDQFGQRQRNALTARAERIKQEDRFAPATPKQDGNVFTNINPEEEIEPEEINDPLLGRTALPDGVRLIRVEVGDTAYEEGVVDIELSPLGLNTEAKFWLADEDDALIVVRWDPVTGRTSVREGTSS